jgi:hypothetical protein
MSWTSDADADDFKVFVEPVAYLRHGMPPPITEPHLVDDELHLGGFAFFLMPVSATPCG